MHISWLIYHVLEAALFWDVSASVWFFSVKLATASHTVLYSYRQMRRDYKIKLTDKSKENLIHIHLIHLNLAKVHRFKGLTSPCIISYLHFLNLNSILTLPQTFVIAETWFGLTGLGFLPARFTRMRASLWNQNKCKPSI